MGMSGNLSESGLFINTNRKFAVDSPIELELLLPGKKTAFLKGIIKRISRAGVSSVKNGLGIQIVENDQTFIDFVKADTCKGECFRRDHKAKQKTATLSHTDNDTNIISRKNTFPEKRRHRRLSVGKITVTTEIAATTQAVLMNISKSGMLVKSNRRLTVGYTYPVKIRYRDKTLSMRACAMWALLVEGVVDLCGNHIPFYLTGMQFPGDLHVIESFLAVLESDASVAMIQIHGAQQMSSLGMRFQQRCNHSNKESADRSLQNSQRRLFEISETETAQEIIKNEKSARRYFERGKLEFWNGNFAKAKRLFECALSHDSSSGKYHSFYAQTLAKLGNLHEAEQAIQKALNLDPFNSDYMIEAGNIYSAMGLSGRAKESYETALNLHPSSIEAHKALFRLRSSSRACYPLQQ